LSGNGFFYASACRTWNIPFEVAADKKKQKQTAEQPAQKQAGKQLKLDPAKLLAALSYMSDVTPDGCRFHSWRVALLAAHLAAEVAPDIQRDVFYAGLLHDIGAVGAYKHITEYPSVQAQLEDSQIRNHPRVAAAMLDWLPGMSAASSFVKAHHEWWDGSGYPMHNSGKSIPMGGRILAIADMADLFGCIDSPARLTEKFRMLSRLAGRAWPKELWAPLVQSTRSELYHSLRGSETLVQLVARKTAELPAPEELANEEGVERALHLFAAVVDVKDPTGAGHSFRTARYAEALMRQMGQSDEDAQTAYRAGLVHDSGRVGVPSRITNRAGRLTNDEFDVVRGHAQMTMRIFNCLPDCPDMAELGRIAGHDHEHYDGAGYPSRLAGDNIPLVSRVLSVVDSFDAMVSTTSYRMLSSRCAVIRLQKCSGTQFDPEVVDAMIAAMEEGTIAADVRRAA